MKKLLSFLGGLTIFASSTSTVISCGPKEKPVDNTENGDNTTDESNTIEKLIQDLRNEASKIIKDHFKDEKIQHNLIKFSSETDDLSFFNNFDNIKKYGTNKSGTSSSIPDEMTKTQWDQIYKDISVLSDISSLIQKINKLGTESGKYDVIKKESIYDSSAETYLSNSIKIEYTNKDSKLESFEDDYIISKTDITLKIGIFYNDKESVTQRVVFDVPLVFSYSSDQELVTAIKKIQSNILADYLKKDTYSWIDSKDLGYNENNSHEIFDLYKDSNRNEKLSEFYKGEAFKKDLIAFVKEKYLSDGMLNRLEVDFATKNGGYSTIISNKIETTYKVDDTTESGTEAGIEAGTEAGTYAYFRSYEKSDNFEDALNAIMVSLVEENTAVNFKNYGIKQKNDVIYNLLKSDKDFGLLSQLNKYRDKLNQFLENNKYDGKYNKTNSFMNGTVDIDNLELKINDDFSLEINTFSLSYAISIDKNESSDNNDIATIVENTFIGSAIYHNVVKGVQSFQNVFGTRKPTVINGTGEKAFTTPFAFTGQTNDGKISGNLWESEDYFYDAYNTENGVYWTNNAFSLNRDKQGTFRSKLLNDGFQETFFLGYTNFLLSTNKISEHPYIGLNARFRLNREVGKGYYLTNETFPGFETRYTGLRIQLNFLNVVFAVDPFGGTNYANGIGATFIERAAVS